MLAFGIRYLNGFVAASHGRHEQVEWPPHPARVFMALVASHYQTGADPTEREALLWLEALPEPPEILAPEVMPRAVVTHYVPVNDDVSQHVVKQGKVTFYQEISGTAFRRNRQERVFARAWPTEDTVFLHWPAVEPSSNIRHVFATLCAKVTRIGHSSSLVQMWVTDEVPAEVTRWLPDEARAICSLRVTAPGTLAALDRDFNSQAIARYEALLLAEGDAPNAKARSVAKKKRATEFPDGAPSQRRPRLSFYRGYAQAEGIKPDRAVAGSVFSPHFLVFSLERLDGPYRHLDLTCALALAERWREALASHANDLSPEAQSLISGHASNGGALQAPHLAFLPLGFVGHSHADGRLSGMALALPAGIAGERRVEVLRAVGLVKELCLGRLGKWRLEPARMARPPSTLRAATWTAHPDGTTRWSTVTPIAYDQHPKAKDKAAYLDEVAAMIANGCDRIGLPRPREVIVTPVSAHLGTPAAHAFPRLHRKDGTERRHTHAILVFGEPVRGPVLLGAGRYRGYGLCRPIEVEI